MRRVAILTLALLGATRALATAPATLGSGSVTFSHVLINSTSPVDVATLPISGLYGADQILRVIATVQVDQTCGALPTPGTGSAACAGGTGARYLSCTVQPDCSGCDCLGTDSLGTPNYSDCLFPSERLYGSTTDAGVLQGEAIFPTTTETSLSPHLWCELNNATKTLTISGSLTWSTTRTSDNLASLDAAASYRTVDNVSASFDTPTTAAFDGGTDNIIADTGVDFTAQQSNLLVMVEAYANLFASSGSGSRRGQLRVAYCAASDTVGGNCIAPNLTVAGLRASANLGQNDYRPFLGFTRVTLGGSGVYHFQLEKATDTPREVRATGNPILYVWATKDTGTGITFPSTTQSDATFTTFTDATNFTVRPTASLLLSPTTAATGAVLAGFQSTARPFGGSGARGYTIQAAVNGTAGATVADWIDSGSSSAYAPVLALGLVNVTSNPAHSISGGSKLANGGGTQNVSNGDLVVAAVALVADQNSIPPTATPTATSASANTSTPTPTANTSGRLPMSCCGFGRAAGTLTPVIINSTNPVDAASCALTVDTHAQSVQAFTEVEADSGGVTGSGQRYMACTVQTSAPTQCLGTTSTGDPTYTGCVFPFERLYGSTTDLQAMQGLALFDITGVSSITPHLYCELNNATAKTIEISGYMCLLASRAVDNRANLAIVSAKRASASTTFDAGGGGEGGTTAVAFDTDTTNDVEDANVVFTSTEANQDVLVTAYTTLYSISQSGNRRGQLRAVYCAGSSDCGTTDRTVVELRGSANLGTDGYHSVVLVGRTTLGAAGNYFFELQKASDGKNVRAIGNYIVSVMPTKDPATGIFYPIIDTTNAGDDAAKLLDSLAFKSVGLASLPDAPSARNVGPIMSWLQSTIFPSAGSGARGFTLHGLIGGTSYQTNNGWIDSGSAGAFAPNFLTALTGTLSDAAPHAIEGKGAITTDDGTKDVKVSDRVVVALSGMPNLDSLNPTATATGTNTPPGTSTNTGTVTQTPTRTATGTVTATPTQTRTFTQITPRHRMPDVNGDGSVILGLGGAALTADATNFAQINNTIKDPDGICSWQAETSTSADAATKQELVASTGGKCLPAGGVYVRTPAADKFADVRVIDAGFIYDFYNTYSADKRGICYNPGHADHLGKCRLNAAAGMFQLAQNRKCVGGTSFANACTFPPSTCAGDVATTDPIATLCKANVRTVDDGLGVEGCERPGLCHVRAALASVKHNIERQIDAALDNGAVPIVILPWMPVELQALDCSATGAAITSLPSGTPAPDTLGKRAPWEVGYCDLWALRQWLLIRLQNFRGAPRAWIDMYQVAAYFTGGKPWRIMRDYGHAVTTGVGSCTCLTDQDCSPATTPTPGACASNEHCSGGTLASCATDSDCQGSNSQAHPGQAWCITQSLIELRALALRACVEEWSRFKEPFWEGEGLLHCQDPGYPNNPAFTPWETYTRTPTATGTATRTPPGTATATDTFTSGPTPTFTATFTASPAPPATIRPQCNQPQARPDSADKLATLIGRQIRDHADWIMHGSNPANWYGVSLGSLWTASLGQSRFLPNELRCLDFPNAGPTYDDSSCTRIAQNALNHFVANKSSLYGVCLQTDWHSIWQFLGDPVMPVYGYCSLDATHNGGFCTSNADCTGAGTCTFRCDTYKFGIDIDTAAAFHVCTGDGTTVCAVTADCSLAGGTCTGTFSDPAPPGNMPLPDHSQIGQLNWEMSRCYEEYVQKRIEDELQNFFQTYDPPHTLAADTFTTSSSLACADGIMSEIGNDITQFIIPYGCTGCCATTCDDSNPLHVVPCDFTSECPSGTGTCRDWLNHANPIPNSCRTQGIYKCYTGWTGGDVRASTVCATAGCELASLDPPTCDVASSCPNAKIACADYFALCDFVNSVITPVRRAVRGLPGGAQ